jgi:hypothetical protein
MKRFLIFCMILSFAVIPIYTSAQTAAETKGEKLIEVTAEQGKILVFPSPISGPDGKIIRFVVYGAQNEPEVVIATKDGSFSAVITAIEFKKGEKYFGWFDVPQEEIYDVWINGNLIPRDNN